MAESGGSGGGGSDTTGDGAGTGGAVTSGGSAGTGGTPATGTGGDDGSGTGGTSASGSGGTGGTETSGTGGAGTGGTGGVETSGTGGTGTSGSAGAPSGAAGSDCQALEMDAVAALNAARACDPNAAVEECTASVQFASGCMTRTYVNPANADAIARFNADESATKVSCPPALGGSCAVPIRGQCDAMGLCDSVLPGGGQNCKANGIVYASGESNIADPTSCNTCTCENGTLDCTTESDCDKPCPDGQVRGQACSDCDRMAGVAGQPPGICQTTETRCFWPCSAGCSDSNLVCDTTNQVCVDMTCP
ncbi:MAG TPA: hypothetical protein VMI54_24400 [Polyangiaceae bacterium]|nr:hypothetical protein [Polyangiaceae bacterium]